MVQNAPGLILDLDVVANILPVENGGLTLNVGDILVRLVDLLTSGSGGVSLEVIDDWGSLAAAEEKDLTLGFGLGNILSCRKVGGQKESHESEHDTQVAPQVVGSILETFAKVGCSIDR